MQRSFQGIDEERKEEVLATLVFGGDSCVDGGCLDAFVTWMETIASVEGEGEGGDSVR